MTPSRILILVFLLCSGAKQVSAEQFGPFTYAVRNQEVAITDYPEDAVGDVAIPAVIDGKPVTKIERRAFSNCTGITRMTIPKSVISIDSYGNFSGLSSLTSIVVDQDNPSYASDDGVLFDTTMTKLIEYPRGRQGAYAIPEGVKSIGTGGGYGGNLGNAAFENCRDLTSVTLPKSLIAIGRSSFAGCTALTEIVIPKGVVHIDAFVFYGCSALALIQVETDNKNYASVDGVLVDAAMTRLIRCPEGKVGSFTIPLGIKWIEGRCNDFPGCGGAGAFENCSHLTRVLIPEGITWIGMNAFSDCTALATATLPSSVSSIGIGAFSGCTALTSVIIPSSVSSIGWEAFKNCSGLTTINIPSGITYIPGGTFENCSQLTSVLIPSSVSSIGWNAFKNCSRLTSVLIPEGITWIGDCAFRGCTALTSIIIPSSVSFIYGEAFKNCSGLTAISIPNGIRFIFDGTFEGCRSLTNITLPEDIELIAYGAFADCEMLQKIFFLGDAPTIGSRLLPNPSKRPVFENTHPDFTIYYLSGRSGFASPTWEGHPTVMIDEAVYPAAAWSLRHGFSHCADLHQDVNGDGVSLLMAYALGLDPNQQLLNRLPSSVFDPNTQTLSLSFHGASRGINYLVETSTDLQNWTTEGLILSDLGPDNQLSASVKRDSHDRYLRLMVKQN